MLRFTVRFDRYTQDNEDNVPAKENFPLVNCPERQLLEQMRAELGQNNDLAGLWDTYHSHKVSENLFCVWVGFDWPGSGIAFVRALQKTFDEHGMSGFYEILDVVGRSIHRQHNRDLLISWCAEALEDRKIPTDLLEKIAGRLSGMHTDDLTTAERQISQLLLNSGHLRTDDQGNLMDEAVFGMA